MENTPVEDAILKQQQDYLAAPNHCPFCGSDQITAGTMREDSFMPVSCDTCEEDWFDIYELKGFEKQ